MKQSFRFKADIMTQKKIVKLDDDNVFGSESDESIKDNIQKKGNEAPGLKVTTMMAKEKTAIITAHPNVFSEPKVVSS